MRKKTLLPITLMCVLALVGCGGNKQSSSSPSQSAQPSSVSSSSQPVASSSSSEPAPVSSSSEEPSTAPESSSDAGPESSEDPTTYGVAINNKDEFADWHAGDANITLDITLTPEANVRAALMAEELVITSSDESKVSVSGLILTPKEAGDVTITATYHGQSDSVNVNVKAEDIKTISEIINNGKSGDVVTFKGYYLGHNSRTNYVGGVEMFSYVYVADGQQSIILYSMSKTFLNGIEIGDLIKVSGKYGPYNGLPETSSGSVTKLEKTTGDSIVRPVTTTIDAEHPNFTLGMDNIGSKVHVVDAEVTKIVSVEAKNRNDIEPAVDGQAVTTNYYERKFNVKVGTSEYELFINERYVTPSEDISNLSVGDKVTFDAYVNIPEKDKFDFAMPENIVRTEGVKDPVQSLELVAARDKVYVGKTLPLTSKVLPETALQSVTWASSNPAVATIDSNGVVTGVSAGKTTITVTSVGDNTKTQSVEVTVIAPITEAQHAGTQADPYTVDDAVIEANKLKDKAYSANEMYVQGKVYSSSYDSTNGYTIWLEDATGASAFELYRVQLDATIFTNEAINEYYQGNHKDANNKDVGNLVGHTVICHGHAQKFGSTLELAAYTPEGGTKIVPQITSVSEGVLAGLELPETLSVVAGRSSKLALGIVPVDASIAGLVWESSVPAVATVDQEGNVSGLTGGDTVITARLGEISASCTVSVTVEDIKATSVEIQNKPETAPYVGDKFTLTADVQPANTTDELSWETSDATKATVSEAGLVTVLDAGEITITAKAGTVSNTYVFTATHEHGTLITDPLTVDQAVAKAAGFANNQKTAKTYFIQGTITEFVWSNLADANKLTANFYMSGTAGNKAFQAYNVKAASTEIAAKCKVGSEVIVKSQITVYNSQVETVSGACSIEAANLVEVHATGISLNKDSITLEAGENEQLVATVTPEGCTDDISWVSDNEAVATVSAGKVVAVAGGSAKITATVGSFSAECNVTVNATNEVVYKSSAFAAANNSAADIASYTNEWYSTTNGFRLDVVNFNTNKNGWNGAIASGSKNNDMVSKLTTHEAIDKAITKVGINFTQANVSASVSSIDLEVSTDGTNWTKVGSYTYATGEQFVKINTPAANQYYRVVFNMLKAGSNGFCRIDGVNFYVIGE